MFYCFTLKTIVFNYSCFKKAKIGCFPRPKAQSLCFCARIGPLAKTEFSPGGSTPGCFPICSAGASPFASPLAPPGCLAGVSGRYGANRLPTREKDAAANQPPPAFAYCIFFPLKNNLPKGLSGQPAGKRPVHRHPFLISPAWNPNYTGMEFLFHRHVFSYYRQYTYYQLVDKNHPEGVPPGCGGCIVIVIFFNGKGNFFTLWYAFFLCSATDSLPSFRLSAGPFPLSTGGRGACRPGCGGCGGSFRSPCRRFAIEFRGVLL